MCNAIASSANLNKIGEEPFPLPKDKEQCYDSQFDHAEPLGELTQEDALPDHSPQPHQVISVFFTLRYLLQLPCVVYLYPESHQTCSHATSRSP
jgi:hypothetical protein